MIIEKREFTKGLNSDAPAKLIPNGQYLNLMNGRVGVSAYGRDYRIENRPGTTKITNSVFPPYGTHFTLGSCIDEARKMLIFFNWNSFGYSGIYALDLTSFTTYAVLYDSQVTGGLNLSKPFRIDRNCRVVGNLLYWVDDNNENRRMNYIAGIKMNHPSFSTTVTPYSWPMTQSVINLIRRPYGLPVTATKVTSGAFANNYVKNFSGQFASRLIYRDGEYSVMSVPSEMINFNYNTDTFNLVQITFPLSEIFDQDVQIIELAVRYNNSPDYFRVKRWDKENATDLAAINAHNAGTTNLTYNFFANIQGDAIGQAESVKPEDVVPRKSKSIEYADGRIFLGNNLRGFNTPTTTSLSASLSANGSDPDAAFQLKANSSYQIAIRFKDNSKRSIGFAVTNSNCIVTNPDRSYSTLPYNSIAWSVSNVLATAEIPLQAYYYDILITKCLRTRYFLSWFAFGLQYAKKNPDGTFAYTSIYDGTAYGLAIDLSSLNNSGYGYTFNEGDLCRLYLSSTATVYELEVLAQDGKYVIVESANLGSLTTPPAGIFEIYTPHQQLENEPFYTTGQTYKITNPATGSRQYSTTSGIITGDTVRSKYTIPMLGTYRLEFMSPNFNYANLWTQFYGEVVIQSNLGEVDKENFVQWSNVKIIGSQTNGLSTFDAGDEKALAEVGELQKLQLTNKVSDMGQGDVMLGIFPSETASLYLGETQVMASAKTTYVAQSTEVVGTVNFLTGSSGTLNPESVISYLGNVYWIDALNGCITQYSPAGLEPVSRYDMVRFFANYSRDYLAASTGNLDNINGFHHIPSCIDPFNKEIIFTLPGLIYSNYANTLPSYSSVPSYATSIINRFDIYDQLGKTMVYKYLENRWGSNYEFMGEWYDYFQNQMIGFKDGYPYTFDTDTINWNRFFGTDYPVRICLPANFNQSLLKTLNNIALEGSDIPGFTVAMTIVPNTQITDLSSTDTDETGRPIWSNQQGNLYATFLNDRLSPNASGTADQKIFTGDFLTDTVFLVMCEWQVYSNLFYCNFVNVGSSGSTGQKRISNPDNP